MKKAIQIFAIFLALLAIILFFAGHKTIKEGYIGVKYQFGKIVDTNLVAGWNWKVPFTQKIETIDVRQHEYLTDQAAYTKDIQTVERIQVKLTYAIDGSRVDYIVRNIGAKNIESKLIIPQTAAQLKNVIARYNAGDLMAFRSVWQEEVEAILRESLAADGIVVANFSVLEVDFDDAFEETIRDKVAAATLAQTRVNETIVKEEEAKQTVVAAQAKADSAKIAGEAEAYTKKVAAEAEAYAIEIIQKQLATSPEYTELQRVLKWNGDFPQVMSDTTNPFLILESSNKDNE